MRSGGSGPARGVYISDNIFRQFHQAGIAVHDNRILGIIVVSNMYIAVVKGNIYKKCKRMKSRTPRQDAICNVGGSPGERGVRKND